MVQTLKLSPEHFVNGNNALIKMLIGAFRNVGGSIAS